MTIASILLHAPAGSADPSRGPARWALGAAAALGAKLTVVAFDSDAHTGGLAGTHRSPRAEGEAVSPDAQASADRILRAAAEVGVEARAVTDRSFAFGLPEVVADHARLHDLVVSGADRTGLLSERAMVEHLVFEAGRPVLVVPADHDAPFRCERVVIAWDNSRAAARALGDAMPFLKLANAVSLVTVEEKRIESSLNERALTQAFAWRGIAVRHERIAPAGAGIAEVLGRHATGARADLLVLGAFGHSRLREFVLGGATRGILDAPRLPVLLSH